MADEDLMAQTLLKELSQTRYACSDLTKLNGGTANFLYRGRLLKPLDLPDGAAESATETVVVKHSEGFSPGNRDFLLDITRCVFEESMLQALADFSCTTRSAQTVVRSPRLYLFDRKTNTQVLEDCSDTTDLKMILTSSMVKEILPGSSPESVGYDVGSWLRSYHHWTSEPGQARLRATIGQNTEARRLKREITYDSFLEILETYPGLIEGHLDALKSIKVAMTAEFELNEPPMGDDGSWGLIHGDFWSGNVLVPNAKWQESRSPGHAPNRLFVIDWELAQFGHRAIDIGGMLADLYERNHFKDSDAVLPAMKGFADGYGRISDEMAFRTAIHAGVHLICWHIRRNPNLPLSAPMEKVLSALTIGRDLVLKGWEKDRLWLENSVLAALFAER
ncbi:kinase-like domain-containing protein [Diaporthe sp. PMI_573]|nr:kinase-like domain-containing protein [Diaporthaceae sp. PMI_573]